MQPETYYHIYNHANGFENLYRSDANYLYFLRLWAKHIAPVAHTHVYCLMPNHFHFLIKTKSEAEIIQLFGINTAHEFQPFGKFETFQKIISKQFSNLFSAYTQGFNKMWDRKGSLFVPNFKRKPVTSHKYLTYLVHYIHHNAVHHGFCDSSDCWPHSSYHAYLSDKPTLLNRLETIEWFDGSKGFKAHHNQIMKYPKEILLE